MLCASTCLNETNHGMSASTTIVARMTAACQRESFIQGEERMVIASTFCHAASASTLASVKLDIIPAPLQFAFRRYLVEFGGSVYYLVQPALRRAANGTRSAPCNPEHQQLRDGTTIA